MWANFPLLAQQLGALPLQKLVIIIVDAEGGCEGARCEALGARDVNSRVMGRRSEVKEGMKGLHLADVTLLAEKKMIRDLVLGSKTLKVFRLEGFRDECFSKDLQARIR